MYLGMWFLFSSLAGLDSQCAKWLDEENGSVFAFSNVHMDAIILISMC